MVQFRMISPGCLPAAAAAAVDSMRRRTAAAAGDDVVEQAAAGAASQDAGTASCGAADGGDDGAGDAGRDADQSEGCQSCRGRIRRRWHAWPRTRSPRRRRRSPSCGEMQRLLTHRRVRWPRAFCCWLASRRRRHCRLQQLVLLLLALGLCR